MKRYSKPQIKSKKVKLNQFLSNRFFDSLNFPLVGPVFAQSQCDLCGVCASSCNCACGCNCGGGGGCGASGNCGCANCGCGCAQSCGSCFLKGTMVLMADGSTKAIEEIEKEDAVLSYNNSAGETVKNKVIELIVHENSYNGYFLINDSLKVTPEHVMYINGDWKAANSIIEGDKLLDSEGQELIVENIEFIDGPINKVYNLTLEGPEHNYFAENYLVHNVVKGSCSSCFLKGTMVLMADGSRKPIEKVGQDDSVISYDAMTNNKVKRKVYNLLTHDDIKGGYLIVNSELKVTPNHGLYINEEWKLAEYLKVGDSLLNSSGEKIIVKTIEKVDERLDHVYNLSIEGPEHNYFAEDILVHNITKGTW